MSMFAVADPVTGLAHMLAQPYLFRALGAGTLIAAAAGGVGYFLVLRSQVFTGDALSHVAFTGALAALAAGIDLRVGLFATCIAFALVMAALGRGEGRGGNRPDDVVIGSVFAWVLGVGVLCLSIYSSAGGVATTGPGVLFGSIFGLSASAATIAAVVAAAVIVVMAGIARPLLFSSLDPAVAAARGVPVTALGLVFLGLVGVTAGEATQAVGALLLLGLIAAPAGAAQRLSRRPWVALYLSVGLAVASLWAGIFLAYAFPRLPPSFAIVAAATAAYVGSLGWSVVRGRGKYRRVVT